MPNPTFYSRLDLIHPLEPIGGESRERLNTFSAEQGYLMMREGDVVTMTRKNETTAYEFPWAHVRRGVVDEPETVPASPQAKGGGK